MARGKAGATAPEGSGQPERTGQGVTHGNRLWASLGPGRAAVTLLALLAVWAVLGAIRPGVTHHLAPAVVVWTLPLIHGETRRGRIAVTGIGVAGAILGAAILRAAGWLAGPVLFGGDAFGEAVLVALGAGALPVVAIVAAPPPCRRSPRRSPSEP